jgi:RNA polymerase sigma-70 factor (ECF subfamily)
MKPAIYGQMLNLARRHTRRAAEAEDLLQDALVAAIAAGRADFERDDNRRWLAGVIRKRALFVARGAGRRVWRETAWSGTVPEPVSQGNPEALQAAIADLAPSLRLVAALALSGHSRAEIGWLLRLSDTALRQRISTLRRALAARGFGVPDNTPGLSLDLPYGRIRDALLPQLVRAEGLFASHDPDGHLFIIKRSQTPMPRQQGSDQTQMEPSS